MVKIFFYDKLNDVELIRKISNNFTIHDGYIIIKNYDIENNILEISSNSNINNKILCGKIVSFNMDIDNILKKINEIEEYKFNNDKIRCSLNIIWANKFFGGLYETYIICYEKSKI